MIISNRKIITLIIIAIIPLFCFYKNLNNAQIDDLSIVIVKNPINNSASNIISIIMKNNGDSYHMHIIAESFMGCLGVRARKIDKEINPLDNLYFKIKDKYMLILYSELEALLQGTTLSNSRWIKRRNSVSLDNNSILITLASQNKYTSFYINKEEFYNREYTKFIDLFKPYPDILKSIKENISFLLKQDLKGYKTL